MTRNNNRLDVFDDTFLTYVAELYYTKELSQTDIAERMGVSKMTVSRSLKRAAEKGIVCFSIRSPITINSKLSSKLESLFPDISITVINESVPQKQPLDNDIGIAFALKFGLGEYPGKTIGVGIGATVASFVHNLIPNFSSNTTVTQLLGGLPEAGFTNPFTILNELVTKLHAKGVFFTSHVLVESKEVRDTLLESQTNPDYAVAHWSQLDTAIFGIGRIERGNFDSILLNPSIVRQEESEELLNSSAVADILGHCFDSNGRFVDNRLEERLASIPLDILWKVEHRVALAGSSEKAKAIFAVLKSGILTELFTDQSAANAMLNLVE